MRDSLIKRTCRGDSQKSFDKVPVLVVQRVVSVPTLVIFYLLYRGYLFVFV